MKGIGSLLGIGLLVAVFTLAVRLLGLDGLVRESLLEGRLLDGLMGTLSLLWLLVLLKAPWDLFFQAHAAAFEQQRARERGIALLAGREEGVSVLRRRLLIAAIGAHVASAVIIALVAFFTHRVAGYWFSGFYLLATLFRPALAGYGYLKERLRRLVEETTYPREDIVSLRARVQTLEQELQTHQEQQQQLTEAAQVREALQAQELAQVRGQIAQISQAFEAAAARFTDQKAVIEGLQAIARLVARA